MTTRREADNRAYSRLLLVLIFAYFGIGAWAAYSITVDYYDFVGRFTSQAIMAFFFWPMWFTNFTHLLFQMISLGALSLMTFLAWLLLRR